jgi:hypothetical protein
MPIGYGAGTTRINHYLLIHATLRKETTAGWIAVRDCFNRRRHTGRRTIARAVTSIISTTSYDTFQKPAANRTTTRTINKDIL